MDLVLNKFQSELSKEKLGKEIYSEIVEYINTVPLIKNLIQPEYIRKYAKDRPRDEDGKIIVDVTNPHILEDMNYFRERAIFYEKHGKYTNITPNPNPRGEYAKFWKEEVRRWKEGYVRESDGEWIPGYLYFYWNYSPIWLVKETGKKDKKSGRTKAERKRAFPKPWLGDYLYYHYIDQAREAGLHGKLLKTRGVGFSFKMGSISPCNMYTLPGSGNVNYHLASDKTFLQGDKGIFGKVIDVLDWIAETTPLPRIRLNNSLKGMEIQLGYQDSYGKRKGLLSSVFGISLKHEPQKARGIRGPLIHYEEDGLFPDLEEAWGVNIRAVESGTSSFGFMLAGGTGGTEGASFEGSKKLFYYPETYHIYSVPNVYDKNVNGQSQCGFFWGSYMNRENCYDISTGEPDVIKALSQVIDNRLKIKRHSNDPAALTQAKAEEPITPQEAIMRTVGTLFPVGELSDHLVSIEPKMEQFTASHFIGELIYDPVEGVKWKPNAEEYPLRKLDVDKINRKGAVEIFELPKKDATGKVTPGRYIIGVDPIDADEGESLFSCMVMDLLTDRIVAEYTGRYPKAEQCYEIVLKLCMFYNAQANYESNLKGIYSYFKYRNSLGYLADTPEILKDMELLKPTLNNQKGTRATAPINAWGRQLQASWQLTKAYTQPVDEDGEEVDTLLNLHTLRSPAYIQECISWNPDGNFDRVSAGNMLFILREDRLRQMNQLRQKQIRKSNSWANSSFFSQSNNRNSPVSRKQLFRYDQREEEFRKRNNIN